MRHQRYPALLLVLLLAPLSACADTEPADAAPPPLPQRVLFVGNSFTFYNNGLHTHLRRFVRTSELPGKEKFAQKMMTISGARLAEHGPGLAPLLASFKPDVVVLQGHSMEPIDAEESAAFQQSVKVLAGTVRRYQAEPWLLMTWAYSGKPEMTEPLAQAYLAAGAAIQAEVIPAGRAFALAEKEVPSIELRVADHKHPTLAGSYLAAAVVYAALYRESPEELAYSAGLPEVLAQQLKAIAWQSVTVTY